MVLASLRGRRLVVRSYQDRAEGLMTDERDGSRAIRTNRIAPARRDRGSQASRLGAQASRGCDELGVGVDLIERCGEGAALSTSALSFPTISNQRPCIIGLIFRAPESDGAISEMSAK
jgi:hypothetical protein